MTHNYSGWRFLYSPRWLGYYAMILIFAIACVLLANWQFDRREQARAEIARIVNNYDAQPVALKEALPELADFDLDKQKWLPFVAQGEYIGEPALVRNRPGAQGTGSVLVQAFKSEDGTVIFVDRGWVDTTVAEDGKVDFSVTPLAPEGIPITLNARLRASEAVVAGRSATADSAGSINSGELKEITGVTEQALVTGAYAMLISEDPQFTHGALPVKPELDEGPHLSYALQWIVFIAIAGTGIVYAARQEFKNFNRGSKAVADMEAKKARRAQKRRERRGASDAEEEDALLDS